MQSLEFNFYIIYLQYQKKGNKDNLTLGFYIISCLSASFYRYPPKWISLDLSKISELNDVL